MDLRRLELFLAVVDHGGFSAAARAIHVAQPSISLAVKELERELHCELLVRSRHGVVPTAAGDALVGPARRAIRELENARDAVGAVTGLRAGHLDLASLPTLAADPLAALVGHFRRDHPAVTVRLSAPAGPDELADAIRAGSAEIGVTESGAHNQGLVEIAIATQGLVLVTPPDSGGPDAPVPLAALASVPLVLTAPGTSLRRNVEEGLAAAGVRPTLAVESAQRDALVTLVAKGAGASLLPPSLADAAVALGAIVRATEPVLTREVAIVHRGTPPSPAGDRFLELARPTRSLRYSAEFLAP
jgi:DNA-binding transcriptional LysR family regulator